MIREVQRETTWNISKARQGCISIRFWPPTVSLTCVLVQSWARNSFARHPHESVRGRIENMRIEEEFPISTLSGSPPRSVALSLSPSLPRSLYIPPTLLFLCCLLLPSPPPLPSLPAAPPFLHPSPTARLPFLETCSANDSALWRTEWDNRNDGKTKKSWKMP